MLKRAAKRCNLFSIIAAKRVKKQCYAFYHRRIKPVLKQISLLQVAKVQSSAIFWGKFCTWWAIYWPEANLVCSKWQTSRIWRDSRLILSNQKYRLYSRNLQRPDLQQDMFHSWTVKRATSVFKSICSNVAKQVTLFSCPFYRSFSRVTWPSKKLRCSGLQP